MSRGLYLLIDIVDSYIFINIRSHFRPYIKSREYLARVFIFKVASLLWVIVI